MGRRATFAAVTAGLVIAACSAGGVSSGPSDAEQAGASGAGAAGAAAAGGSSSVGGGKAAGSAGVGAGAGAGAGGAAGGGPGQGGATSAGAAGDSSSFGGGIVLPEAGMPDVLAEGCDGIQSMATRIPLTIYVMADRSASTAGDHWKATVAGLKAFIADPGSKDITVGLTLFPADVLENPQECSFMNYQDPLVPFGKLPDNATALTTALDAAKPNGQGSPIYPALGGGLQRAITIHNAAPKENVVVLLVTDGTPEGPPDMCGGVDATSQDVIGDLVDKAFTQYGIRTFVVGLPGLDKAFSQFIAKKGGSDAISIAGGTLTDIQTQFQTALAKVRGEGLGCTFPLPPDSSKYNVKEVNVRYTDGAGAAHDLNHSASCASADGWEYDDEMTPTKIILCPTVCGQVKADGMAQIQVVLGCPTREVK